MKSVVFIIAMLLLFNQNTIHAQNWVNLGPMSIAEGRSENRLGMGVIKRLKLTTINNVSKLYASSPDGGLWLCNDILVDSWQPISDNAENIEVVSFCVSKSDFNKIYMVTNNNEIYKSIDLGRNWIRMGWSKANGIINVIEISWTNDEIIFVGSSTGVYVSENGGLGWEQRRSMADVTDLAIDQIDDNYIYCGIRRDGVYQSKNRGLTWTEILNWNSHFEVCNNILDGEGNIDDLANRKQERADKITLAIGYKNRNGSLQNKDTKTIAVKMGSFVYVTNSNHQLIERLSCWGVAKQTSNEWYNTIAINPNNPEEIIVGKNDLRISSDSGLNWQPGFIAVHEDNHSIQYLNDSTFFVGTDGGVSKVTLSSSIPTASRFHRNLCVAQFLRFGISGNIAVGNSNHNGIMGTDSITNGIWQRAVGRECGVLNNYMEFNSVYIDNLANNRFYIFDDTELLRLKYPRSNNSLTNRRCEGDLLPVGYFQPYRNMGGNTTNAAPRYSQGTLLCLTRTSGANSRKYIFVSNKISDNRYSLKYTLDGTVEPLGTNVNDASNPMIWQDELESPVPFVALASNAPSRRIYAITNSGVLYSKVLNYDYSSTDWGTPRDNMGSYDKLAGGIIHMDVSFSNSSKIYAISQNALFVSSNCGNSWVQRYRNNQVIVDSYLAIKVYNVGNRTIVFLATSQGIYKSTNDGITWSKLANFPNVKVSQLHIVDGFLYAVTYGRGLWRVPITEVD